MMTVIFYVLVFYAFMLWCWSLYLSVMTLSQKRDQITNPWVRFFAYQVLAVGLFVDIALLNPLASLFVLADYPHYEARCWKFTDTLKFQRVRGGRRGVIAAWMCENLLNPFDPKGTHC